MTSASASTPGPAAVRPRYGAASLADVLPGVLAALGVPGSPDPLGLAGGPLRGIRSVVVLLVDGLGHHQIPLAAPYVPVLSALATASPPGSYARALTTGFPSTTPTSLASFGTGAPPGGHGLLGFYINVPGTDRLLNHIEWGDDPDPWCWQPLPTQFDRAVAAGVRTRVVGRPEFAGSGLTVAAYRGAEWVAAASAEHQVDRLIEAVSGTSPALACGYLHDLDKAGHLFGVESPEWRMAAARVDSVLERLLSRLPEDCALVVTADHGQLDVPAAHRIDIDADPALSDGLRILAGEPRVRYLHTLDGARDDVLSAWRAVLGKAAWVVEREQAVAEGWFGPVSEEHLARVGDIVAACHADYALFATRRDPPTLTRLVGFHGSATEIEMRIPLLIARR